MAVPVLRSRPMPANPVAAAKDYLRHVGQGLHVVDVAGLAEESYLSREGRADTLGIALLPSMDSMRAVSSPAT